jgi:hypothetical protein
MMTPTFANLHRLDYSNICANGTNRLKRRRARRRAEIACIEAADRTILAQPRRVQAPRERNQPLSAIRARFAGRTS